MRRLILAGLAALLAAPVGAAWGGARGGGHVGGVRPGGGGMGFAHSRSFNHGVVSRQAVERAPGRYYEHNEGGWHYWHYYGGGLHWYGFYFGPRFFWFPYWGGYWWWWDPAFAAWTFWSGGYWWWYGPGGAPYLYYDGSFVPYDQYAQQQEQQQSQPAQPPSQPPSAPPASAAAASPAKPGSPWKSPDGRRMVQITGANSTAVLYDATGSEPVLMKSLAPNVENVRFSGGTKGQPVRILLDYANGDFGLFDADGNPVK